MAPWGEKEDVECEDPANAAPMNFGPEPEVIPPAADTFVANVVHLKQMSSQSPQNIFSLMKKVTLSRILVWSRCWGHGVHCSCTNPLRSRSR